jgi:ornithine carbamoyltransferase
MTVSVPRGQVRPEPDGVAPAVTPDAVPGDRSPRRLVSLRELPGPQLRALVHRSAELYLNPAQHDQPLRGRVLGMLFEATSTRTRTAFTVGTIRLGGAVIGYGPAELQLATGESVADTGRILGCMLDGLVVRTRRSTAELCALSDAGGLPVVNAMAAEEHPTQAICDLATLLVRIGELSGLTIGYIGEGNNTARALVHAVAGLDAGIRLVLATPAGYGVPADELAAVECARPGTVRQVHELAALPDQLDVVYTTRWQTTGTTKSDADWREVFRPFHVDDRLLSRWPQSLFMHDLPAHRGDEVASSVLDGDRSIAWCQAAMKLTSAMAVLEWLMATD